MVEDGRNADEDEDRDEDKEEKYEQKIGMTTKTSENRTKTVKNSNNKFH